MGGKGYSFGNASGTGSTRETAELLATQLLHTDTPTNRTDDATQLTNQLEQGMNQLKQLKKKYFEYTPVHHFTKMCAVLSDASNAQASLRQLVDSSIAEGDAKQIIEFLCQLGNLCAVKAHTGAVKRGIEGISGQATQQASIAGGIKRER